MSTTNPSSGAGPAHGHEHGSAGEPVLGGVDPTAVTRGHEADTYDTKSVFSVPMLVVLFFVLAFGTVTILFRVIAYPGPDPTAHPGATERNSETLNKRLERITRGGEVDQPRLEDLKLREGEPRAITSPEKPTGNSPFVHPEDIRPSQKNTPDLYRSEWVVKDKIARISLTEAMQLALKQNSKVLPTLPKGELSTPLSSEHRPTAANAGRGFAESRAELPPLPEGKK
jgi:hypothetical protein